MNERDHHQLEKIANKFYRKITKKKMMKKNPKTENKIL